MFIVCDKIRCSGSRSDLSVVDLRRDSAKLRSSITFSVTDLRRDSMLLTLQCESVFRSYNGILWALSCGEIRRLRVVVRFDVVDVR